MSVLPKNTLVIDTINRVIEIQPFINSVILEEGDKSDTLNGEIFISHSVAVMLKLFIDHMRRIEQCPEIGYLRKNKEDDIALYIILTIYIEEFPVWKFASNFKLIRILEKGIEHMAISASSMMDFNKNESQKLEHWLDKPQPICNLSVNGIDPKYLVVTRKDIAHFTAKVQPLDSFQ